MNSAILKLVKLNLAFGGNMKKVDDTLDSVFDDETTAKQKGLAKAAYEEKIVKKILTHAGLSSYAPTLANLNKEKTGNYRITFDWFFDQFPTFPTWCAANKFPYVQNISVVELFDKFLSSKIFCFWEELYQLNSFEKPTALIFDWPGMHRTQMVLHDDIAMIPLNATLFTTRLKDKLVYLQHFDHYFEPVLQKWVGH